MRPLLRAIYDWIRGLWLGRWVPHRLTIDYNFPACSGGYYERVVWRRKFLRPIGNLFRGRWPWPITTAIALASLLIALLKCR